MTATVRELVDSAWRLAGEILALPFLFGLLFRTATHSTVAMTSDEIAPLLAEDNRLLPSPVAALRPRGQWHRDCVARLLTASVGGLWWYVWRWTILDASWPLWYRTVLALQIVLLVSDPALWLVHRATERLRTDNQYDGTTTV